MTKSLIVVVALLAGGCSSPTGPSPLQIAGTWQGTVFDTLSGQGAVQVTFNQSGADLTGTWATIYPSGNNGGTLSGRLNGSALTATLMPSVPQCALSVTATVSGNTITGTYAAINCGAAISGAINVAR